jgi:hypothetical protein
LSPTNVKPLLRQQFLDSIAIPKQLGLTSVRNLHPTAEIKAVPLVRMKTVEEIAGQVARELLNTLPQVTANVP